MVETERPHRSSSINNSITNASSSTDLFICFTSKSIHSPARSTCLTTSLSRRLRTSGSLKNTSSGVLNSPMFGATARKRSGSAHQINNNVEPSSPKVSCIGQVRVKTRKHVKKKMRARSRSTSFRRSAEHNDGGGRRFDATDNRLVHFPVTICESLRTFGSELNCFSHCRSSCRNRFENNDGCGGGNSCCVGGKRREIELVVGGEDDAEEDRRRSRWRHVFEELDLSAIEIKTENEEVGCLSICSPPKNALLLMRCRSDPVKVAALANRVREKQMSLNEGAQGKDEDVEEDEEEERRRLELEMEDKKRIELCEKWIAGETTMEREVAEAEVPLASNPAEETVQVLEGFIVKTEEDKASKIQEADSFEEEIEATILKNIEEEIRKAIEEEEQMAEMEEEEESKEVEVSCSEQGNREPEPSQRDESTTATPYKVLPDSLLMMMCEPKLSMEVSKETWVCSTDFVRCLPVRPPVKKIQEISGDHHQAKKRIDSNTSSRRRSIDKPPAHQSLLQPPRSSCSYPSEQKIARASKAYEPPLLPRCKSEPRKSASKLAPEARAAPGLGY